jgi:glutamate 5-kinase
MEFYKMKSKKRIVVKLGTNILLKDGKNINFTFLHNFTKECALLHSQRKELVIVSSGAIYLGSEKLGFAVKTIQQKQAAASIGQVILMQMYSKYFSSYGKTIAQILLTREDFSERKKFLNIRNTFNSLFKSGAIPIVNENDSVAVEEIQEMSFGDNDTLSALVASLINADLLIILSDVEGFYTKDPKKDKNARLIKVVEKLNSEFKKYAGGKGFSYTKGGMKAKIKAAKISSFSGIPLILAKGEKNVFKKIFEENTGTLFLPRKKTVSSRKCWIGFCANIKGKIYINEGAKEAIVSKNKSLLAPGITSLDGKIVKGDAVDVFFENKKIATGLTNYSSKEILRIKGKKTSEIKNILGENKQVEIIHRDNLIIF